jgi:hypothetical protein
MTGGTIADTFADKRRCMVEEQIAARGIIDRGVLEGVRAVLR